MYPGALPSFTNFVASDTLSQSSHAARHNLVHSEVVAIATKVGTGSSTPAAGRVLRGTGTGTSAWDALSLTTDVTDVLPITNGGTGASTAADARDALDVLSASESVLAALQAVYPVGSIYINSSNATNPGTLLGFGTWVVFGAGKTLVGLDSGDGDFDSSEETGGAKTHTLTEAEMPSHRHTFDSVGFYVTANGGDGMPTGSADGVLVDPNTTFTGGGGAHNNLQPYIVVYFWKRTA